jgi:hypothetical protein
MANNKYRIDRLIANAMHFPAVGGIDDPMILYTKVPEYNGSEENIEGTYSKNKNYSIWANKKDKVYSSPRNIMKVYIHLGGVETITFTSPVGMTAASNHRAYGVELPEVELYGNPFKAIINPLVCSNIEEVYIDAHVIELTLRANAQLEQEWQMGGINTQEVRQILMSETPGMYQSDTPYKLLKHAIGNSKLNRIRTVAITKGLFVGNEDKFLTRDMGVRSCEKNAEAIKTTGAMVAASRVEENNKTYSSIVTSPNIYLFDREKLVNYAEKYAERFSKDAKAKSESITSENENDNELDMIIAELIKKYGKNGAGMMIRSALSTMSHDDIAVATKGIDKELLKKA